MRDFDESTPRRLLVVHAPWMTRQSENLAEALQASPLLVTRHDLLDRTMIQAPEVVAAVFLHGRNPGRAGADEVRAARDSLLASLRDARCKIIHLDAGEVPATLPGEEVIAASAMKVDEAARAIMDRLAGDR